MKMITFMLIALAIGTCACQRSQFSITKRSYKNGKVVYSNRHPTTKIRLEKSGTTNLVNQHPDIQSVAPEPERLVASISEESAVAEVNKVRTIKGEMDIGPVVENEPTSMCLPPDTTKQIAPPQGTALDFSARNTIYLKNGKRIKAGIVYQSHDSLFYQPLYTPEITNFLQVEQVDTIILKEKEIPDQDMVETGPESDSLARTSLAFAVIGCLPVIGVPFLLASLILGIICLRKIRKHPELYKGKKMAKTSIIISLIALIVYGAIAIYGVLTISIGPIGSIGFSY